MPLNASGCDMSLLLRCLLPAAPCATIQGRLFCHYILLCCAVTLMPLFSGPYVSAGPALHAARWPLGCCLGCLGSIPGHQHGMLNLAVCPPTRHAALHYAPPDSLRALSAVQTTRLLTPSELLPLSTNSHPCIACLAGTICGHSKDYSQLCLDPAAPGWPALQGRRAEHAARPPSAATSD